MIAQATTSDGAYLGLSAYGGRSRSTVARLPIMPGPHLQNVDASYDAAQDRNGLLNYWVNADSYNADSANRREVREKLVRRSRYEINNNGYADGIAQTYATDLIGSGPMLRMQTGSEGFNRLVETVWYEWTQTINFRRKLWTMAHAKHSDGESFAVLRRNPRVRHRIALDWVLHETEMCQTPLMPYGVPGYIDGMKFDDFGNVEWYDFLRQHPGDLNRNMILDLVPERVRPEFVQHWFKMRRPGQHRGVPECSSTLNLGASARRWREAQLSTAEKIARMTLFLESSYPPDTAELIEPLSTMDIQDGMMTVLPDSMKPHQLDPKHPAAAHESFNHSLISEQARPKSMPRNKAMCDSSSYNYASGRLDHQTYYGHLDGDREDCNDQVLNPLFRTWFDYAVMVYNWLGGEPTVITDGARSHVWDWPKHQVVDGQAEATANRTKLETGEETLPNIYAQSGKDYEDSIEKLAQTTGIPADRLKLADLMRTFPQQSIALAAQIFGVTQPAQAPAGAPANGT